MTDAEEREALRIKYFPRVPWTELGPVRRRYRTIPADGSPSVEAALRSLAEREGFIEPGQSAVTGGAAETLAAFRRKPADRSVGMIFGTEPAAHFCDIACGAPDADGWQELIVRSEEGENLTALAHALAVLRFQKA